MTAFLSILKLTWPYVLCTIGAGYLTHSLLDAPRYDALQTKFATYQAEVAQADAKAQEAARDAVQAQIQTRLQTEAHNEGIIEKLQMERDGAMRDSQFASRLLAAAQARSRSATPSHSMPATPDQPGIASDAAPSGDRSLVADLRDAASESGFCFQQYRALLDQLTPQL